MNAFEKAYARAEALSALGLEGAATQSNIRSAWRRLALETHPDRPGGSTEAFMRVNSAYQLLSGKEGGNLWTSPPAASDARPEGRKPAPPPRIRTRILEISVATRDRCNSSLEDAVGAGDRCSGAFDHVPESVRRKGRDISFLVPTSLRRGANRVALPTDVLLGRKAKPEVILFKSAKSGRATVEIPQKVLEAKFPGARHVRIHFGKVA